MGFLRRLLGQSEPATWPPPGPITEWPTAEANLSANLTVCTPDPTSHTVEVVGESYHQEALERLSGGRTVDGARNPDGLALLLPEPTNRYDPNAVRVVYVAGGTGATIGYLSRDVDSIAYRPVIDELAKRGQVLACPAQVIGGWDDGQGDRGSFGVRLSLDTPASLLRELGVEPPPGEPRVRDLRADGLSVLLHRARPAAEGEEEVSRFAVRQSTSAPAPTASRTSCKRSTSRCSRRHGASTWRHGSGDSHVSPR